VHPRYIYIFWCGLFLHLIAAYVQGGAEVVELNISSGNWGYDDYGEGSDYGDYGDDHDYGDYGEWEAQAAEGDRERDSLVEPFAVRKF
jgi:hypothetical protein